ncbi:hypothetical protein FHT97_006242 [Rhizobium sp. BK399]|nr:hypothetical protein [Rhizobium sp. BK399]
MTGVRNGSSATGEGKLNPVTVVGRADEKVGRHERLRRESSRLPILSLARLIGRQIAREANRDVPDRDVGKDETS